MPGKEVTGRNRLLSNVIWSWVGHLAYAAGGFVMPRLLDDHLGASGLGVWDFCWSVVNYFVLVNLGASASVSYYVAKHRASNDIARAAAPVATALLIQCSVALATILLSAAVCWAIPVFWAARLGSFLFDAQWAVLLLGMGMAIRTVFATYAGIISGCHRWDIYNLINSVTHAAVIVMMIAVVVFGGGLKALACTYLVESVLCAVSYVYFSRKICRDLRFGLASADRQLVPKLIRFGGKTYANGVSRILIYQTNSVLIMSFLGPASLALYSRPMALLTQLRTLCGKFANVVSPVATELKALNDPRHLKAFVVRMVQSSIAIGLPGVLFVAILGGPVVRLWMGADYRQDALIATIALGHLLTITNAPLLTILTGLNAHGKPGIATFVAALCSIPLTAFGLGFAGGGLQVAALCVSAALWASDGVFLTLYLCRKLDFRVGSFLAETWFRPTLCILPFVLVLIACRLFLPPLAAIATALAAGIPLLLIIYWKYLMTAPLRAKLASAFANMPIAGQLLRHASTDQTSTRRTVFLRYWGSYFKSARQAGDVATLFEPFARRNWICWLVLEKLPEQREWLRRFEDMGIKIVCVPRPRGHFDLRCIRRAYRLCRESACDVFQCDNMHTSPTIGAWLASAKVRIWYKRSMSAHFEECRKPRWRERLAVSTRISYRLATNVFAISNSVRDELIGIGAPSHRITVLNNPRPSFDRSSVSREEARRSLEYKPSHVVIVSVGHAVQVKGWDLLLRAFSHVAAVDPRAMLLLVGSTIAPSERAFFQQLQAFILSNNLAERVKFTGHIGNVAVPLSAGDLFVLPSRSEGCCNALLEALEIGLPCIATRVGNAEEAIEPGHGFLVLRNNVQDLADKMVNVVKNDTLRASLKSRAAIPAHITTRDEHAEQIAQLYSRFQGETAI